jgi:hypothetical protein
MAENGDDRSEPVHLVEDPNTGDRFLVYGTERGLRLDIRYEGDTLWMTQAQIGELFGRDQSVISRHMNNVLAEGELDEEGNMHKVHIAGSTKPVTLYSLDMIISVGYRCSSAQATLFRRWATQKLVQFATKGFVVDADRLKKPENADRVAVYRELRRICAMCQDYDGTSEAWREFYQNTQAKLLFAVTSHTPSEIIDARADAKAPNMGLTTWPHDNIRKQDVTISKNYLADREITELNRLTTILLDIFEDQLDIGRLVVMDDVQRLLDKQLMSLNRAVLSHGGRVRMTDARQHAEREYDAFSAARKLERHQEADQRIAALRNADKSLPSRRKPSR